MRRVFGAAVLGAICCIAACSIKDTVGSRYAKSQLVQALQGGVVTVTAADVASSSASALAGTSIQIPPNALAQDTVITIAPGSALTVSTNARVVGPVAVFGPSATAFRHPSTVVLPFALAAAETLDGLTIQGVDSAGNVITVSNADLKIDASANTVAFTVANLVSFGPVWVSGSVGTNATCCPAGEAFCGCGNVGECRPTGEACNLDCPEVPPNAVPSTPVCCPAGEYLCGCGGEGTCIPDSQACPMECPVCDPPNTFPSPCGCLPPGAVCDCDPAKTSTAACQCDPRATVVSSTVCRVDGGSLCPGPSVLTSCGCLPPDVFCAPPPDAGNACGSSTDSRCCDGTCVSSGQACPNVCERDGGVSSVDGGICPSGTNRCPNGTCVGPGVDCIL